MAVTKSTSSQQKSPSPPPSPDPIPKPPSKSTTSNDQDSSSSHPPPKPSTPPPPSSKTDSTSQPVEISDSSEIPDFIDFSIFEQILELDEDDTHDFSKTMTDAFFDQAETTFDEMDTALLNKDLKKLSSLGHFLKGSSAALGLSKVQASCEKIQHYGLKRDEEASVDLTEEDSLSRIKALREQVKLDYDIAEKWLKNWYTANVTAASGDEEDS
ncbi:hypothetical protein H0H93_003455 [Arthromyces matolae]|nr:hypothetical protein H0H93_003455 [Arthromyces matolae]